MAEYRYIGDEPRYFPTLGLHAEPQQIFETDLPVASTVVVTVDGKATHVDDDGFAVADPTTNAAPSWEPSEGVAAEHELVESILGDDSAALAAQLGGAAPSFEDLTKAELEHLAQELKIHGRSSMDKEELIEALRIAAEEAPQEVADLAVPDQTEDAARGADNEPQE